jgi:2-alkenal reductase
MTLDATQRGALVADVQPDGPAGKAGLRGSDSSVTIDGQDVQIGGDLITAIDGSPVKTIEDVIAYLADHTSVGQKVTLSILRAGQEQTVDVTLQARPAKSEQAQAAPANPQQGNPGANNSQGTAWLGIAGQPLTPEINQEMNLANTQTGVLVTQVQAGSPADKAGLQGSFKPVLINGQRVLVGGDVITAIDASPVTSFDDLQAFMQSAKPGQDVTLTVVRDGKETTLSATLTRHP